MSKNIFQGDLAQQEFIARLAADTESIRVQMGTNGRIVYGKTASGEERRELTSDRIAALTDAISQPAATNLEQDYSKKRSAIEIQVGGNTVFRQERDGVVSVNQLQLQQEAQVETPVVEAQVEAEPVAQERNETQVEPSSVVETQVETSPSVPSPVENEVTPEIQVKPPSVREAVQALLTQNQNERIGISDVADLVKRPEGNVFVELIDLEKQGELSIQREHSEREIDGEIHSNLLVYVSVAPLLESESHVQTSVVEPPLVNEAPIVEAQVEVSSATTTVVEVQVKTSVVAPTIEAQAETPVVAAQVDTPLGEAQAETTPIEAPVVKQVETSVVAPIVEAQVETPVVAAQVDTRVLQNPAVVVAEQSQQLLNLKELLTPEQTLVQLERDVDFWKTSALPESQPLIAKREEKIKELKGLGVQPDETYRQELKQQDGGKAEIARHDALQDIQKPDSKFKLPGALAVAARLAEALPDSNTKQVVKDWVNQTGKGAVEKAWHKSGQLLDAIKSRTETFKQDSRNQQVASVVSKLVNHHQQELIAANLNKEKGVQQDYTTYKGENYTLKLQGRNTYEVFENGKDGKEDKSVLRFKATGWSFKVLKNELTEKNYRDFEQTQKKMERLGLGELAPGAGKKHLGGLAPVGSRSHEKSKQELAVG